MWLIPEIIYLVPTSNSPHCRSLHLPNSPRITIYDASVSLVFQPTYSIQSSRMEKNPKWIPRSCCGQYMVVPPSHSSTICRIINLTVVYFSTQYHVIYEYQFTPVLNAASDGIFSENPFSASRWKILIISGIERHVNPDDFDPSDQQHGHNIPDLHVDWIVSGEVRQPSPSGMAS